jgi:hypothetical protein
MLRLRLPACTFLASSALPRTSLDGMPSELLVDVELVEREGMEDVALLHGNATLSGA